MASLQTWGALVRIDILPKNFSARQRLDEGWSKNEVPSVCTLIADSISGFQSSWNPIERPTWLHASSQLSFDPLVGRVDTQEQPQLKPQRAPIIISCPGLGSTYLPEVTPHITLLNPSGSKQAMDLQEK